MKRWMVLAFLLMTGCPPEFDKDEDTDTDTDTETDTDTDTDTETNDAIVGDWRSDGDNISPLFAAPPFNYVQIDANFAEDMSYSVTAVDSAGAEYLFSGTYTIDETTEPGSITQSQASPFAATAEGIWQIDVNTLTFEVVQVDPDFGFTAPTSETGFGSTAGPGIDPDVNTQVYERQ